jgi:hypothetical protein
MTVFQILEKMHLNQHTKIYEKIYILLNKPDDIKLLNNLKLIARNKLSPFEDYFNTEYHCYYAFINPKNKTELLSTQNVDLLLNILIDSDYKIEYDMINLLNDKDRKNIFCFISK